MFHSWRLLEHLYNICDDKENWPALLVSKNMTLALAGEDI
jgi:hypothetical protein